MAASEWKIATAPLFIGYARAHSPGDRVHVDAVKEHGWQDGVANEGTKAAEDAAEASIPDGPAVAPVGPSPK